MSPVCKMKFIFEIPVSWWIIFMSTSPFISDMYPFRKVLTIVWLSVGMLELNVFENTKFLVTEESIV